jgi:hypothetical protein
MMILQTLRGNLSSGFDPDAKAYILAVEAADGQTLDAGVKKAYNTFVKGCKSDGIWDAIKASCIMAGARTLSGALVPLKGTAPMNFNFVSGDYDRVTGLKGNGSTKYLDSRSFNHNLAFPQDDFSVCVYITSADTGSGGASLGSGGGLVGAALLGAYTGASRSRCSTQYNPAASGFTGFHGTSRSSSAGYDYRRIGLTQFITQASQPPIVESIGIFGNIRLGSIIAHSNPRIFFYSIGESLDLAKLDGRVSTLVTQLDTSTS